MDSTSLKPWERVQQEFACEHERTRLTVFTASNGTTSYRVQCVRCGHPTAYPKKSQVDPREAARAIPYDEEIQEKWYQARSKRFAEIVESEKTEENQKWKRWYDSYLSSPEWATKRAAVLSRDKGICQGCLKTRATQVHHLTYEHAGDELLFELISVCNECHERIHANKTD